MTTAILEAAAGSGLAGATDDALAGRRESSIGRLSLRHRINDDLRRIGGHVGYDLRPSMRRRG